MQEDGAALADPGVEGEQAGADLEGGLIWQGDDGFESSAADQGRATGGEGFGGLRIVKPTRRAGRQALGREDALAGETEFESRDPWQQRAVRGAQPSFAVDGDGSGMVTWKGQGPQLAIQGGDQVASLRLLPVCLLGEGNPLQHSCDKGRLPPGEPSG